MKKKRRLLILVEKQLGGRHGKTAHGVIRYTPEQVVAVIDRRYRGKTCQEVLGYGGDIPVVGSVKEGLQFKPNALLIGLAIAGGALPKPWRKAIAEAIRTKLDVINGLHTYISTDAEFAPLARRHRVKLIDLRMPPPIQKCSEGIPLHNNAKVILTVGTDGAIGKMSVMLEIVKEFKKYEPNSVAIATGQTGMMITNNGYAADAVKSDFVGGIIEEILLKESNKYKYLFVEGQGSLVHQGFSAVTLGLMHGALPDVMIMCHRLNFERNELGAKIPSIPEFIKLHEQLVGFFKPSKIIAIAINSAGFPEDIAKAEMASIEKEYGLPVDDCVRFGGKKLADVLYNYIKNK